MLLVNWQAIAAAFHAEPERFWQPRWEGRRGHPVVYPTAVARRVLALNTDQTPRTVIEGLPSAARGSVTVDDPAVRDNVDTPADLARLRARSSAS